MLRRHHFLLLCLTSALPLAARPALSQPLPDRIPFVGEVRDQDGQPLGGVVLSIRRQDDTGTYAYWGGESASGPDGRFRFPEAEEGRYYLNAEKTGYAPLLNQSIAWPGGQDLVRLRLERMANIKLRFLKPDGTPLKNSVVQLRLRGDANTGQMYRRSTTDLNGVISFADLIPSRYSIYFVAPGIGNALLSSVDAHYSPDPQAVEVQLQQGGSLQVHAVEKLADGAPGKPLGGVQVMLLPSSSSDTGMMSAQIVDPSENLGLLTAQNDRGSLSTRDGDGMVTLTDLPPGQYSARLFLPGWTQQPPKNVEITAGQTTQMEWAFAIRPSASLSLSVHNQDGKPAANQELNIRMLPLSMTPGEDAVPVPDGGMEDGMPYFGNGGRRAITDGDGNVVIYPLRPGRYRIWVAPRTNDPDVPGDRRRAVTFETQAGLEGGHSDVTLPAPPPKP